MPNDKNERDENLDIPTDLKSREKQQNLKKHRKPKAVEERPADRTRGQEEGKIDQPWTSPDS